MRVLYAGGLGATSSSLYRRWAIARLGHEVIDFDSEPYLMRGGSFLSAIRGRTLAGPTVAAMNRDLLELALHCRPDLVWFDKATFVRARTVRALRANRTFTVHFNIDNPFGPRQDPGWRLIRQALPEYDLHLVQRDSNLVDYRNAGARDVLLMRTAYEPTVHFAPPEGWSDADRSFDLVFIGAPYDRRPQFLIDLLERHGIVTRIWGDPRWPSVLPATARSVFCPGGPLWNDAYRETIWRSRICLSFVTHSNCDDVAHKSFEITACGAFMLAEDTAGHRAHFVDGEEAVFFLSAEDCARKIHRFLPDEAARCRIARAGCRRAAASGYSNDGRIEQVFAYLRSTYGISDDSVRSSRRHAGVAHAQ
jgi:hypothetical protein